MFLHYAFYGKSKPFANEVSWISYSHLFDSVSKRYTFARMCWYYIHLSGMFKSLKTLHCVSYWEYSDAIASEFHKNLKELFPVGRFELKYVITLVGLESGLIAICNYVHHSSSLRRLLIGKNFGGAKR